MNIVLLGAPGSGKGSQAELLVRNHGLKQISTGNLLRDAISACTEDGELAKTYVEKGMLVPDELVLRILKKEIDISKEAGGIVFDGFPRNIDQAKALEEFMASSNMVLDAVFNIISSYEVILKRLKARRICQNCERDLTASYRADGDVCSFCGGKIIKRRDDEESVIEKRFEVYKKITQPLIEYFRGRNILIDIDGDRKISEVYSDLESKLQEKLKKK